MPLPRSRIPAGPVGLTFSDQLGAAPIRSTKRAPTICISGLNHAASVPAAYASSSALPHSHARLASGWWLALAGGESNSLDSDERFRSTASDFPLSQVYPGASSGATDIDTPSCFSVILITAGRYLSVKAGHAPADYEYATESMRCSPTYFRVRGCAGPSTNTQGLPSRGSLYRLRSRPGSHVLASTLAPWEVNDEQL